MAKNLLIFLEGFEKALIGLCISNKFLSKLAFPKISFQIVPRESFKTKRCVYLLINSLLKFQEKGRCVYLLINSILKLEMKSERSKLNARIFVDLRILRCKKT